MNDSAIKEKLFFDNEVKTNRLASIALGIMGLTLAALILLDALGIYELGGKVCWNGLFISGIIDCSVYPIARFFNFNKKWIKRLILAAVIISSSICFFLYPLNADFLTYGPIIISAMYYDRSVIKLTGVITCVCYGLMLQANVVFESTWEEIRLFHEYQEITIFRYPMEILTYYFLPHVVFFFVVALVCDGIARRGNEFLIKQAVNSREISMMENELNAASQMQLNSLPERLYFTENGNIAINAMMRPAKAVGGDFYDYFISGNNLIFLVADVSDKGLPAALFMMKAKNAIRASFMADPEFEKAVNMANGLLCSDNKENMFITLWIASINVNTGVGKYANCGHLPPMIRRSDGQVVTLENDPDMMLGVFENTEIRSHVLRLKKDDTLVVFTDGLTDAINEKGESFGDLRLLEAVRALRPEKQEESNLLFQEVDRFVGDTEQFDDMTSIRVHIQQVAGPAEKELELQTGAEHSALLVDEVNRMLEAAECPENVRRNIDVALDEVCENISEYAYEGEAGAYSVKLQVGENYAELIFRDAGKEFNPLAKDTSPEEGELRVGGLGIYLYLSLMDQVGYTRSDNKNILHLMKTW